ncbi:hypothetical protein LTR35_018412, partial [Friedmanniomyces endolithicus]
MELNATQGLPMLWDSIMDSEKDSGVPALRQSTPQDRDDGFYARGRSPPPFRRQDATLQSQEPHAPKEESNNEESNENIP